MADQLAPYRSDMAYLKRLSDSGSLNSDNHIYKRLSAISNLPELSAFLSSLRVNYV